MCPGETKDTASSAPRETANIHSSTSTPEARVTAKGDIQCSSRSPLSFQVGGENCNGLLDTTDTCVALPNAVPHTKQHRASASLNTTTRLNQLVDAAGSEAPVEPDTLLYPYIGLLLPAMDEFVLCGNDAQVVSASAPLKEQNQSARTMVPTPHIPHARQDAHHDELEHSSDCNLVLETMDSCVACATGVDLQHAYEETQVHQQIELKCDERAETVVLGRFQGIEEKNDNNKKSSS